MEAPRQTGDSFKKIFSDVAGLSSANVSPIYEDKAGNIWIASMNFGVYRYDGKKLVFASNRNAAHQGDTNVFITDWVE